MQRLQAFKFELMPNGSQVRDMRRFGGACRFVYNKALALQKENHEAGHKFIGYVAMAKHLTAWRHGLETPWLKEAPCHPLQHALKDLEKAYQNFFARRADFPRFKRKGNGDSFRYPDPKQIKFDQGWGEFRRQLAYKMAWNGGMLVAVPPHHTSQTCPACKHVSKDNRQTQALFLCVACGYENHADVVGAINILERGLPLDSLWRVGAVRPLREAGTHRSDCAIDRLAP